MHKCKEFKKYNFMYVATCVYSKNNEITVLKKVLYVHLYNS